MEQLAREPRRLIVRAARQLRIAEGVCETEVSNCVLVSKLAALADRNDMVDGGGGWMVRASRMGEAVSQISQFDPSRSINACTIVSRIERSKSMVPPRSQGYF